MSKVKSHIPIGSWVKVSGWKGEYRLISTPVYHDGFRCYIAKVQSKNGQTIKVPIHECTEVKGNSKTKTRHKVEKVNRNAEPINKTPWYMQYHSRNPREFGITNINAEPLVKDLSQLRPGTVVARVTVFTRGKSTAFTLYHTGTELASNDIAQWKSQEALGSVICRVREYLIQSLAN